MGEGRRHLARSRSLRLSSRGIGALIVAGVAVLTGYATARPEMFAVGGAATMLVLVAVVVIRIRRPRLHVGRAFSPGVVAAGGVARVTLRIVNRGASASTRLSWNDALPWRESQAPHELSPIPARGSRRAVDYELHPPRRGLFAIGPLVVQYEDPFGMLVATLAVGQPDRLVVVPAVSALPEGGPVLAEGEGMAQLVQRRVAGSEDDLSTREYRPGDAVRRVHWRASARHGELMVRQEEHRSHPDARVLIDTREAGYADAEKDGGRSWSAEWSSDAFEWAVRMTASLGVHLEALGFRVTIEETTRAQIEPLGARWDGRRSEGFLTSLAAVHLLPVTEFHTGALGEPVGPVFAVLGHPDSATVEWLLHRRGADPGFAFVVDGTRAVRDRLIDAGWIYVDVDPEEDPAIAWRTAALGAGLSRGRY